MLVKNYYTWIVYCAPSIRNTTQSWERRPSTKKKLDFEDYFAVSKVAVCISVLQSSDCYAIGGKITNLHI
jgi:hypothetical protein